MQRLYQLNTAENLLIPPAGWTYFVRHAYSVKHAPGMSMRQPGSRMDITPQSVREFTFASQRRQQASLSHPSCYSNTQAPHTPS